MERRTILSVANRFPLPRQVWRVIDSRTLEAKRADYRISRLLFARVWRLTKPFWARKEHWRWWVLMIVLLAMTPGWAALNFWLAHVNADMTNAIIAKERTEYTKLFWLVTSIGFATWAIQVVMNYMDSLLNVRWRAWLTDWMVTRYLHRRTYYDIALREDLDNPDQRMQEDTSPFITVMSSIPRQIIGQVMSLITGSIIIASISMAMTWYVVGYAVISTIVTLVLYTPMIRLNFDSTVAEADLRYGILHVRDNAETVAFYRGEETEHKQIGGRLATAVRTKLAILLYELKMGGVNMAMSQLWSLAPFFLIAPLFFEGKIEYGTIAMAVTAATQMLAALTVLTQFIPQVAGMAPRAVRLAQILERFDALDEEHVRGAAHEITTRRGSGIALCDVCLETPGGEQRLVQHLSLVVAPGRHLLIDGQTGVGKSSLLRTMAGLWWRGSGTLVMPDMQHCLFLPQKPYMILSDLRSQLLYPHGRAGITDDELQLYLERVNLPHLIEKHGGLDAIRDWAKVLSLGEQQRIGFARVLVARPEYVFLDEATSAVDINTEHILYTLVAGTGATFISVGHRPSIVAFHVDVLRLFPGGRWDVMPAQHALLPDKPSAAVV